MASDPADPTIQSRVLMCPPPDCFASGCIGHRFIDKQPIACGVDTVNADIGTTYELSLVVYDSQGNSYTVNRVIDVISPCTAGQFYCSGACSRTDCKTLASLSSFGPPPTPPPTSPILTLLPTIGPPSAENQTIYLGYGRPAPFSLGPCTSISSNSSAAPSCAASAYDLFDGDLSYAINVVDVTSTPGHVLCSSASMSQMTKGQCLPGQYLIRYSVTNSVGLTTSAFLNVIVQELTSYILNYSFVLSSNSDNLSYVTSYANDLLTFNSTSASSLVAQDLPSFGIDVTTLRSLSVNKTSVESLTDIGNGTMIYPILIQLTVVTVRVVFQSSKLIHDD